MQQQQSSIASNAVSEEQAAKLRRDLAEAQQEVENLRASASIDEVMANTPAEDGTKSVAEQVKEHVEQIRADLELRHSEKVKQAEETFQRRSDLMKTQFNKKVPEIKDQLRQSLAAEHEKVLESLGSKHQHDMQDLQIKHQAELDDLKRKEESRLGDLEQTLPTEQSSQNDASKPITRTEEQARQKALEPTEEEARELVGSNATIRGILSRNIADKVAKAKEILAAQLKEEHEKTLADKLQDAQNKANAAKEQAVMTEEKRNSVKLSMAESRIRTASFRLTLVQKAADETPQKAVVEVWTAVKDAKPPPTSAQQPQQKTPQRGSVAQSTSAIQGVRNSSPNTQGSSPQTLMPTGTFGQPTPNAPTAAGQSQQPPTAPSGAFGRPTPVMQNNQNPFAAQGNLQQAPMPTGSFGQPTPMTQNDQKPFAAQGKPPQGSVQGQMLPPQGEGAQSSAATTSSRSQPQPTPASQIPSNSSAPQPSQGSLNGTQGTDSRPSSNIPIKPPPPTAPNNQTSNQGPGQAALRSLQNSGLPVARGGRGGQNPRGRGRGVAHGGGPGPINTSQNQGQQGRASPTGSQLSGGAKQFVPGNKRAREDSGEGGHEHGSGGESGRGKRLRGGLSG